MSLVYLAMINKGYIIVIVIVLCCIAYFNFRGGREKAAVAPKAGKTGGKADASGKKPAVKPSTKAAAATTAASAPSGGQSPNTLYKAVHAQMSDGMTHAEFTEAVPSYDVGMMYIELKQLYSGGKTPTAADYARVMKAEGV